MATTLTESALKVVKGVTLGGLIHSDQADPSVIGLRWKPVSASENRVKVWIDQDLCTGDGICTDHAPEVFTILEDGIAYCKEGDRVMSDPGGAAELALVPLDREAEVVAAANECPGECIFVEFVNVALLETATPRELSEPR